MKPFTMIVMDISLAVMDAMIAGVMMGTGHWVSAVIGMVCTVLLAGISIKQIGHYAEWIRLMTEYQTLMHITKANYYEKEE